EATLSNATTCLGAAAATDRFLARRVEMRGTTTDSAINPGATQLKGEFFECIIAPENSSGASSAVNPGSSADTVLEFLDCQIHATGSTAGVVSGIINTDAAASQVWMLGGFLADRKSVV